MVATVAVLCSSCGGRLARDNTGTVCSPCRRTHIEMTAQQGAHLARDRAQIGRVFDAAGLYGVALHLDCSPEDAVDVLLSTQLVPFVSQQRRLVLRRLAGLGDRSHIAAGEMLNVSRWTIATYRRQLGIDRHA
jgi:hypothetical protein